MNCNWAACEFACLLNEVAAPEWASLAGTLVRGRCEARPATIFKCVGFAARGTACHDDRQEWIAIMAYTLLLHIVGEPAMMCDADQLPSPNDNCLTVTNLRTRDGKDIATVDSSSTHFIFPWTRINFIEVMGAEEEEEIVGFARD